MPPKTAIAVFVVASLLVGMPGPFCCEALAAGLNAPAGVETGGRTAVLGQPAVTPAPGEVSFSGGATIIPVSLPPMPVSLPLVEESYATPLSAQALPRVLPRSESPEQALGASQNGASAALEGGGRALGGASAIASPIPTSNGHGNLPNLGVQPEQTQYPVRAKAERLNQDLQDNPNPMQSLVVANNTFQGQRESGPGAVPAKANATGEGTRHTAELSARGANTRRTPNEISPPSPGNTAREGFRRKRGAYALLAAGILVAAAFPVFALPAIVLALAAVVMRKEISRVKVSHEVIEGPYPYGYLRFPIPTVLRSTSRRIFGIESDPFQGKPRPRRINVLPFAWLLLRNIADPASGLEAIQRKYGDHAYVWSLTGDIYLFQSDREVIRQLLLKTDSKDALAEKTELQVGGISRLTGRGTVFLGKGMRWLNRRRVMQPYFAPALINSEPVYRGILRDVDRALGQLADRVERSPRDRLSARASDELAVITMNVILAYLFNIQVPRRDITEKISPAFNEVRDWIVLETGNPTFLSFGEWPAVTPRQAQLKKAYKTLDQFAERILVQHRIRSLAGEGFLSALINAEGEVPGTKLTDQEIKREILTMVLAGHETTAATLTWAFYLLSKHPEARRRVMEEIDKLGGRAPTAEEAKKNFPFLGQVIDETLRLYSPAYMLFRKTTEDVSVNTSHGPVFIPKGTKVIMPTFLTHRNENQWGEARTGYPAEGFFPERFDPENIARHGLSASDLETMPFGYGPRICLGKWFALWETELILIRMLQKFDLTPIHPDRESRRVSDMTLRLDDGFPVYLRLRPRT